MPNVYFNLLMTLNSQDQVFTKTKYFLFKIFKKKLTETNNLALLGKKDVLMLCSEGYNLWASISINFYMDIVVTNNRLSYNTLAIIRHLKVLNSSCNFF